MFFVFVFVFFREIEALTRINERQEAINERMEETLDTFEKEIERLNGKQDQVMFQKNAAEGNLRKMQKQNEELKRKLLECDKQHEAINRNAKECYLAMEEEFGRATDDKKELARRLIVAYNNIAGVRMTLLDCTQLKGTIVFTELDKQMKIAAKAAEEAPNTGFAVLMSRYRNDQIEISDD